MRGPLIILVSASIVVIIAAYMTGGTELVGEGIRATWSTLLQAIVLIVAAFVVIGQLQQIISIETINQLLQRFSGIKGIFFASIAGGMFPGPPYVYYPFLSSFKDKKIPFSLFFSFIVGKQIYDFARLPMEVSLINPGLALLRNIITAPFPILMGIISYYIFPETSIGEFYSSKEEREEES